MIKRDATPNTVTVERLCELFGWDGNCKTVQDQNWTECCVQIKMRADEFEGKTRHRIVWINPYDYVPTLGNVDEERKVQLAAQYGPQLRALCSKSDDSKTQSAHIPEAPSTAEPPPPPAPQPQPTESTKDSAWLACLKAHHDDVEKATPDWHEKLAKIDKDENQFTSDDWKRLEGESIPF